MCDDEKKNSKEITEKKKQCKNNQTESPQQVTSMQVSRDPVLHSLELLPSPRASEPADDEDEVSEAHSSDE